MRRWRGEMNLKRNKGREIYLKSKFFIIIVSSDFNSFIVDCIEFWKEVLNLRV